MGYLSRNSGSRRGSALIVAMSAVGVIAVTATVMMGKYFQSAKSVRSSGAQVETNALFRQAQQSLGNLNICSSAFHTYTFQNVETGQVPNAVPVPALNSVINGASVPVLFPGMVSNGVSVAESSATAQAIQLTGGQNYTNYGTQVSGLSSYQGLNCALANLHIVASKESRSVSSSDRHTIGNETVSSDFPITLFTDPNTNQIVKCFGGEPLPGACLQAPPATIDSLSPGTQCVTPGLVNFNWSATGAAFVQINCTSPSVLSGNLTSSPSAVDMSSVPGGTTETCIATAYNSALVPSTTSLTATVHVENTCLPPVVTISSSVACVNPGHSYTISWQDNDLEPTGTETISGPGAPASFTPPVTPGGSLTQVAPAGPSPLTYGITDSNFAGTGSAAASVLVIPPPSFTTTLNTASANVFSGSNIVFNYNSANATGVSYSDPVTHIPVTQPLQGPSTVIAPLAGGSYQYTYTLAGGCAGDPPVTASANVTVCQCVTANELSTLVGLPSLDSCGISRAQCPGTKSPCTCVLANEALAFIGQPSLDSCGVLNLTCQGKKAPCTCIPGNEASASLGAPSVDTCGVLNAACPGTLKSCACVPSTQASATVGVATLDSCGVLNASCPGTKACTCIATNQASTPTGQPTLDTCSVLNPSCPGTSTKAFDSGNYCGSFTHCDSAPAGSCACYTSAPNPGSCKSCSLGFSCTSTGTWACFGGGAGVVDSQTCSCN